MLLLFSSSASSPNNRGQLRVYISNAWAIKPVKVWDGTNWVKKNVRYWTGSAWAYTFDTATNAITTESGATLTTESGDTLTP